MINTLKYLIVSVFVLFYKKINNKSILDKLSKEYKDSILKNTLYLLQLRQR